MLIKRFFLTFLTVYILVSLPDILGIGFVVIDWVPEATLIQKIKGTIIKGIVENYLYKILIAFIVGIFVLVKAKWFKRNKDVGNS